MAEINGQLSICDRCGVQIFRRKTGEGEADGGWTRWDNFKPYPEGWRMVEVPVKNKNYRAHNIRVCPECSALWDKILEEHYLAPASYYNAVNMEEPHE